MEKNVIETHIEDKEIAAVDILCGPVNFPCK